MEPSEHNHCYQDEYYPQQWRSQEVHHYNPSKGSNGAGVLPGGSQVCLAGARSLSVSSFRSLVARVFACSGTLSGDGLERIQAMLSELREVAWLAGIVSILSILGIGVAVGVALVAFA
jgi:hypothetical protein